MAGFFSAGQYILLQLEVADPTCILCESHTIMQLHQIMKITVKYH